MSSSLSTERTFFIDNLGCAKNQVDAEVMIAALERDGWRMTDDPSAAGTILVNTCGFIEPAKQESIDMTLAYLDDRPDACVVMTGCLSQRYPDELASELPEVAGIFGNRTPTAIVGFLRDLEADGPRVRVPDGALEVAPRTTLLSFPGSAFVKIAEGCENRCSFCAIPLIRGALRSKPLRAVLEEIDSLFARGVREINLVAQDLASYGRDRDDADPLALLRELSRREGHFWVRLLYVYPERFPHELFALLRDDPRLLPYFDIPFQHASTPVLRKMGRPGSASDYLDLIRTIRSELPDAVIRSTFLVGFFGETPAAFDELLAFQHEARLDWAGVFPYSPEEGTPAMRSGRSPEVSARVARARADRLSGLQREITHERMERFVGRDLDVLIEELVPGEPLAIGRAYLQAPEVDGAVVVALASPDARDRGNGAPLPGELVRCRILRRNGLDLEAVPL